MRQLSNVPTEVLLLGLRQPLGRSSPKFRPTCPPLLGLEEQGRFALGYYCQLAQYRADRREREMEDETEKLPEETD